MSQQQQDPWYPSLPPPPPPPPSGQRSRRPLFFGIGGAVLAVIIVVVVVVAVTQSSSHHTTTTTTTATSPTSTGTTTPTSAAPAAGGALDLGSGISVTPAAGWTSKRGGPTAVDLYSPDNNVTLFLTAGPAHTSDATQALQTDIATAAHDPNYTNPQIQGTIGTAPASGNFDKVAVVSFTADATGGGPVVGRYLEAINTGTQNSVFAQDYGPSQSELNQYDADVTKMLDSLG